jgi:nucleoside-diphosphate-sugar epimerase
LPFISIDICDFADINKIIPKCDINIPLVSIVVASACRKNPTKTRLVNYEAQMNLAEMIASARMVIFTTTNNSYGIGESTRYCTEASPLRPILGNGLHKVQIEQALLDKRNAVTFRLDSVFGLSFRLSMDLQVDDFTYRAY